MKRRLEMAFVLGLFLAVSFVFAAGEKEPAKGKVVPIKFYGAAADYNKEIVAQFEAETPGIKVEIVPIDFNNAAQIIKTGIASGNPVDVSFYWGSAMKTFVDDNLALDVTSYLMANGNQWYNTFVPKFIDAGKYNGKYYAVSYAPVVETFYYNKDLFKKYNVKVPATVAELLEACAVFQKNGLYGIGCWNGMHHQMLPWTYQIFANNGVLEQAAAGKLPLAGPNETPGLRQNLEMIRDVYRKGYWYPGEGALTATQEQVQAAWYQGKIGMIFDSNARAAEYKTKASFEVSAMPFPLVKEGGIYTVNILTNALFVPVNAAHKEEAVKFIKFYTGPKGQALTTASGRPPTTISMQEAVDNPIVKEILSHTRIKNSVGYLQIQNLSSEINTWFARTVSGVCAGQSIDEALAELEKLRAAAVK